MTEQFREIANEERETLVAGGGGGIRTLNIKNSIFRVESQTVSKKKTLFLKEIQVTLDGNLPYRLVQ